jgi:hypothetical protein
MDPPEDGYGSATIFKAEAPGAQRFGSRVSGFGLGFELETQDSGRPENYLSAKSASRR